MGTTSKSRHVVPENIAPVLGVQEPFGQECCHLNVEHDRAPVAHGAVLGVYNSCRTLVV